MKGAHNWVNFISLVFEHIPRVLLENNKNLRKNYYPATDIFYNPFVRSLEKLKSLQAQNFQTQTHNFTFSFDKTLLQMFSTLAWACSSLSKLLNWIVEK